MFYDVGFFFSVLLALQMQLLFGFAMQQTHQPQNLVATKAISSVEICHICTFIFLLII